MVWNTVVQGFAASKIRRHSLSRLFSRRLVVLLGALAVLLACALAGFPYLAREADRTAPGGPIPLRADLAPDEKMTAYVDSTDLPKAFRMYAELTGRTVRSQTASPLDRLDDFTGRRLSRWRLVRRTPQPDCGIQYHRDGRLSAREVKEQLEEIFRAAGLVPRPVGARHLEFFHRAPSLTLTPETRFH